MITEIRESVSPIASNGNGLSLSHALPIPASGRWPPRPFQIVSLLEMLFDFPAGEVADFAGYLWYFSDVIRAHIQAHGQEAMLNDHPVISTAVRERLDWNCP